MNLLRFSSIFSFLYSIFIIITGAFTDQNEDNFPALNIVDGTLAILQITLQIAFIYNLKNRVINFQCDITNLSELFSL